MSFPNRIFSWINSKDLSLKDLIEKFLVDKKIVFLTGSGISEDPPSNNPTIFQFTVNLLKKIVPEKFHELILSLMNPERSHKREPGDFIRFEQVMELLRDTEIDSNFNLLEPIGLCNKPNYIHLLLASLIKAKKGNIFFTTNFDSLIEYGLIQLGVNKSDIRQIIYKEEWEDNKNDVESNAIFKLHGSFENINTGLETRDTIHATINQLTQGKENVFSLESWKEENFKKHLIDKPVIVMGYSGFDDLDAISTLLRIKSDEYLIWIDHQREIDVSKAEIMTLTEMEALRQNREETRVQDLLKNGSRVKNKIILIKINTSEFLQYLGSKLDTLPTSRPKTIETIHKSAKNLLDDLDEAMKWTLTGKLFWSLAFLNEAKECFQKSLELETMNVNQDKIIFSLNELGLIENEQGNQNSALKYFKDSLKLINENSSIKAGILSNMGFTLSTQNKYEEALECFKQSLEIAEELGDKIEIENELTNISFLCFDNKRFEESILYFKKLLQFEESLGESKKIISVLSYTGTALSNIGRDDQGLEIFYRGIEVAKQEKLDENKKQLINNAVTILQHQGKHEQIIQLYKVNFDIKSQIHFFRDQGLIYFNERYWSESETYFKIALESANEMKDLTSIARCLADLGAIKKETADFDGAMNFFKQSLSINEDLNDRNEKTSNLFNIAVLLNIQGKSDDALNLFEKVLKLNHEIGDIKGEALTLNNIAVIMFNKRNVDEGIKKLKQAVELVSQLSDKSLFTIYSNTLIKMLQSLGKEDEASAFNDKLIQLQKELKQNDDFTGQS